MSQSLIPISPDSELCKSLTSLPQKFVVDFANSIDVSRDLSRVQQQRSGLFSRLLDGFTGKSARRQVAVNNSLVSGLEGALEWVQDLSQATAMSNFALALVNDRVNALSLHVSELAHYSADTRDLLRQVAEQLNCRIDEAIELIHEVDFRHKAQLNLEAAMGKWRSGRYVALAPSSRAYAALEEMRWGPLGDFYRTHGNSKSEAQDLIEMAKDQLTEQLAMDIEIRPEGHANMGEIWLATPSARNQNAADMQEAVSYLGDGFAAENTPFTYAAAHSQHAVQEWPLKLPHAANARRIADALVDEVLLQGVAHV